MNWNLKTLVLTVAAIMTLGVANASYAVTDKTAAANPGTVKKTTVATTTTATTQKSQKISRNRAVQIASKAYPGAKVTSVKLVRKVYVVKLTSETKNYILKIGAKSGHIIKVKAILAKKTKK